MSEPRNHPKPDHVDPFDLPEGSGGEAAPVAVKPPADREKVRTWPRQTQEKRRHAAG